MNSSFKERARALLGDEYGSFIQALEKEPVRGARANLNKCNTEKLTELLGEHLSALSYCDNGFILDGSVRIGHTPEHHSGMIYAQDPGAMAALSAVDIAPDSLVIDLCSAPGGKSSQAAERLGDSGFILSNEYVPKRAKALVGNFERLGFRRSMVTSLDTARLRDMYRSVFDLVIVDAPCSGEGMFRKSEEAREEWSVENVLACAERQREILSNAACLAKKGGRLIYSTCTYSLEENEMVVDWFLSVHPDYRLIPVKSALRAVTRDGIQFDGATCDSLNMCRRFYPHISEGEGQFVAVLERAGGESDGEILYRDSKRQLPKATERLIIDFLRENLREPPTDRIYEVSGNPVIIPHSFPIPERSVFMSGVLVGEVTRDMVKPSHQLFSAYGHLFKRKLELKKGDPRVEKYLFGEEIDCPPDMKGYVAVLYEGATLGGGKASGGRLKNHYPKGLRNKR